MVIVIVIEKTQLIVILINYFYIYSYPSLLRRLCVSYVCMCMYMCVVMRARR